jgi:hypothetical protein
MALPNDRQSMKEYCLRQLGSPVVEINADDDQLEDRIDEALQYYADYHFDGTEKWYYKYQVTEQDMVNKYIQLPPNIIGAVSIFAIGSSITQGGIFNIQYQIALNDLYTLTSQSMVPFFMAIQHVSQLEQLLVGQQRIRYNRLTNKFWIDMDWNKVCPGQYLVIECYSVIDPATYPTLFADRWLLRYTTTLFGIQWATNLQKFKGMQLAGGVQFNADEMLQRYLADRKALEDEMLYAYSLPPAFMEG